jgi:rhodanese-related sulfurtransferase
MRELTGPDAVALVETQAAQARPLLLLDVREPWEVALAAIAIPVTTTRSMPMREVPARLSELDAAQPVLCFCHHGARSAQVVAFLERAGFASAYNLAGGIDAWSREVDGSVPRY